MRVAKPSDHSSFLFCHQDWVTPFPGKHVFSWLPQLHILLGFYFSLAVPSPSPLCAAGLSTGCCWFILSGDHIQPCHCMYWLENGASQIYTSGLDLSQSLRHVSYLPTCYPAWIQMSISEDQYVQNEPQSQSCLPQFCKCLQRDSAGSSKTKESSFDFSLCFSYTSVHWQMLSVLPSKYILNLTITPPPAPPATLVQDLHYHCLSWCRCSPAGSLLPPFNSFPSSPAWSPPVPS